jgi:hypothetical protein
VPDTPTPANRRPIGSAIRRNDEARERLSQVGPGDVVAARMTWMRYAPPGWQGLIEARVSEGESRGT